MRAVAAAAAMLGAAFATTPVPTVEIMPGVNLPQTNLGTCIGCGSSPKVGMQSWVAHGGYGVDTDHDSLSDVAQGIVDAAAAGIPREKLFITTHVNFRGETLSANLKALGLSYVDLVLMHPGIEGASAFQKVWAELEDAVAQNLTRALGVSNFSPTQLDALKKTAKLPITVNQFGISLKSHSDDAIAHNLKLGIIPEAYYALKGCPNSDATLKKIASAHGKSTQQICLRYIIDSGCVIVVGTGQNASTVEEYAKEDLDIFGFQLSDSEMEQLNSI